MSAELRTLQGSRLSAIVFVLDYLQIQFEDYTITFSEYPEATVNDQTYRYGDREYRNMICGFIGKPVLSLAYEDNVSFSLSFENGTIDASLKPETYSSPEMVVITLADRTIVF